MLENNIFIVLSIFLVGGSFGMILFKETLFSAFSFLIAMLALAGVFALLNNSFLFLAQIMVSVGAVVVLGLMVIITLNRQGKNLPQEEHKIGWIILSIILVLPFSLLLYKALITLNLTFEDTKEGYGTLKMVGETLFKRWVVPFEAISVLLISALVGAITIARKDSYIKRGADDS